MTIRSLASKKTRLEARGEVIVEYRVELKKFLNHLEGIQPDQESDSLCQLRQTIESALKKSSSKSR